MNDLTKDAQEMLSVIYKEYLDRINNGISKSEAKRLGSGEELYQNFFENWLYDDFIDTMSSLAKSGYISNKWVASKIYRSILLGKSIITMENRFSNDLNKVVDFISKIRGIAK